MSDNITTQLNYIYIQLSIKFPELQGHLGNSGKFAPMDYNNLLFGTAYTQIFEGCKFCCFCNQIVIHDVRNFTSRTTVFGFH